MSSAHRELVQCSITVLEILPAVIPPNFQNVSPIIKENINELQMYVLVCFRYVLGVQSFANSLLLNIQSISEQPTTKLQKLFHLLTKKQHIRSLRRRLDKLNDSFKVCSSAALHHFISPLWQLRDKSEKHKRLEWRMEM